MLERARNPNKVILGCTSEANLGYMGTCLKNVSVFFSRDKQGPESCGVDEQGSWAGWGVGGSQDEGLSSVC